MTDCSLYLLTKMYDEIGLRADAAAARRRCLEEAGRQLVSDPTDVRAFYLGAGALAGLGRLDTVRD